MVSAPGTAIFLVATGVVFLALGPSIFLVVAAVVFFALGLVLLVGLGWAAAGSPDAAGPGAA